MTWNETNPMNEKVKFIVEWQNNKLSMTDLCRKFNISRKTGYKIILRFEEESLDGLKPRSRAHVSHPEQIDNETTQVLLKLKKRYPKWGPKKIKDWLALEYPKQYWPASSTIGDLFKRHGLVKPRKFRAKTPKYEEPFIDCTTPNLVWSADFKGHFRLGTGKWCYPLTISDNYSRFLLGCKALYHPKGEPVRQYFERVFKEYGLPKAIKTDNGTPFASPGLGGLSKLSIWWLKLGIKPERIKPGCPQQNGRHERMHRTLKEAVAMPPYQTLNSQQRALNRFKDEYNFERPHEGICRKRPADVHNISEREYPDKIPEVEYNNLCEVRYVRSNGQIKLNGGMYFISEVLYGEPVGLKEIDDGIWEIYYSQIKLANLDLKKGRAI